jgi:hypothetical protein
MRISCAKLCYLQRCLNIADRLNHRHEYITPASNAFMFNAIDAFFCDIALSPDQKLLCINY